MRRATVWTVAALVASFGAGGCGQDESAPSSPLPPVRAIASAGCSPVSYGGPGKPQLLIGASTPLQGQFSDHGVQVAQALKLVLAQHHWRAGPYRVGLQICDETTAKSDFFDAAKCRSNARAFARNRSVVAVTGAHFSGCTAEMLPILGRAPGGAVPLLSATSTYLGLTRAGPGTAPREPSKFYPMGARNFIRVVPADDVQAAAAATYLKQKGATRAFVLRDAEPYGDGLAAAFATASRRIGLGMAGVAPWDGKAHDYRRLAMRVARSRADAVFLSGYVFSNGPRLVKDLRAALPRAQLIGPDGMNQASAIVEGAGDAAENFISTIAVVPATTLPPAGREFAEEFKRRYSQYPCCFSVNAAQTARMELDEIARSGPDRARIMAKLRRARVRNGLLGDFAIDHFGDTSLTRMGIYRIEQGKNRFEMSISPPTSLLSRR
jgi:branched-chain amino acid transport system substrate-binding protein